MKNIGGVLYEIKEKSNSLYPSSGRGITQKSKRGMESKSWD